MTDPKEMEIKRLQHLKNYVENHPITVEQMGDEYIRIDGLVNMIDKTIQAVRKEQSHRNSN